MELVFETTIACPIDHAFQFHESHEHLSILMRGWKSFRLLHHEGSILPGRTLWIEETFAGCMPVVLGFRHKQYEPPYKFSEEIIHGPFQHFEHIHEFEDIDGYTLIRDRIEIGLPVKYGGVWADRMFVAPRMRNAFSHRHRALENLVDSQGLLADIAMENK